jgi:hypothetical protein
LIKGVIVDDACERIEDAFADFTWPLQRALQQLRRALLIPHSSIENLVHDGTK